MSAINACKSERGSNQLRALIRSGSRIPRTLHDGRIAGQVVLDDQVESEGKD